MSFWDEITKGLNDAANMTAKKTGEITNIAKLKVAYITDKQKLAKAYEDIGRKYFAEKRGGEDNSAEISMLFLTVEEIRAELATLKNAAAKLKNIAMCDVCGKEFKRDYPFCPHCGTKHEVPAEPVRPDAPTEICDCDTACDCGDECDCGTACDCGEKCDCDTACDCGDECDCDTACDCGDECDSDTACDCGEKCDCGTACDCDCDCDTTKAE